MAVTATTGLGAMLGEDLELKQKTLKKVQELQRQLAPSQTTSRNKGSTTMEIDAIRQGEEKEDKEWKSKAILR